MGEVVNVYGEKLPKTLIERIIEESENKREGMVSYGQKKYAFKLEEWSTDCILGFYESYKEKLKLPPPPEDEDEFIDWGYEILDEAIKTIMHEEKWSSTILLEGVDPDSAFGITLWVRELPPTSLETVKKRAKVSI